MLKQALLLASASLALLAVGPAHAASHREAPVTAIDRTADITDWYAFVSPDTPHTILYQLNVDNNQDARDDVRFEIRLKTDNPLRLARVPVGLVGAGNGVPAPRNSPPPVAPGTILIPPAITALDGQGSQGLRQSYEVVMVRQGRRTPLTEVGGRTMYAPSARWRSRRSRS